MTWRHLALGAGLMVALTTPVLTQNLESDLQRAIQREAGSGGCKDVLPEYARIVEQGRKSDRSAAAEALLRIGMCQERTGDRLATVTYASVVNDFKDQRASADDAGRRLKALQASEAGPTASRGRQNDIGPFQRRPSLADDIPGELSPDLTRVLDFTEGIVERRLRDRSRRVLVPAEEYDGDRVVTRTGRGIWSLDGRLVAYTTSVFAEDPDPGSPGVKVELRIVETDSLKVRTIRELPAPGGQLSYALRGWSADNEVLYSENRRSTGGSDIAEFWAVSATGGNPRKVFALERGTGATHVSNVTPDGRRIVIVRDEHLATVDLRSGLERAISLGIDPAYPQISRDGKTLAYLSRVDGTWGLYVTPLADQIRTWVRVSTLDARGTTPPPNAQVRWLSDGTSLALTYENRGDHLYRLDVDVTNLAPVGTPHRLTRDTEAAKPVISPDGAHVAFVRPAAARDGSLFVVRSDGSGERRVAEIPAPPRGIFATFDWWSSSELAFVAPRSTELQRVPLSGSAGVERLPLGGPVDAFSVDSATGVAILRRPLSTPDARPSLVRRRLADGRETAISDLYGNWSVSPDGTRVAMFAIPWDEFLETSMAESEHRWALWLLAVDGREQKKLASGQGSTLLWSPDGAHLLFRNQGNVLQIINVTTGAVRPFFTLDPVQMFGPEAKATLGRCDWARDGSFIVFSVAVSGSSQAAWQGVTADAVKKLASKGGRP